MGLLHNIFCTRVGKQAHLYKPDMRLMLVEYRKSGLDITAGNIHHFESFELLRWFLLYYFSYLYY